MVGPADNASQHQTRPASLDGTTDCLSDLRVTRTQRVTGGSGVVVGGCGSGERSSLGCHLGDSDVENSRRSGPAESLGKLLVCYPVG